jgi:S1-C subfamily serine protease
MASSDDPREPFERPPEPPDRDRLAFNQNEWPSGRSQQPQKQSGQPFDHSEQPFSGGGAPEQGGQSYYRGEPLWDRSAHPPGQQSGHYEQSAYRDGDAGPVPPGQAGWQKQHPTAPQRRKGCASPLLAALLGALLLLCLGGLAGWQIGNSHAPQGGGVIGYKSGEKSVEQIIAQDRQAVVQINTQTGQGGGIGSGVIIDKQGHIITNNHVIANGQKFTVMLFDGTSLPAQLVGADKADDLAVVKITPPSKIYAMPIGDSSSLQVGNSVLAMGNPLGITQTVTRGIVSALGRTVSEGVSGGGTIVDAVQTDAPINPGNSGGALVDMNGNLVGIPTLVPIDPEFRVPATGVGVAVPSNRVKFIAPQLIQHGRVIHSGRSSLGVTITSVDPLVAAQAELSVDRGALIVSTQPGGPAAQAGLKPGDVIIQLENQQVNNTSDLSDALLSHDPGSTVTVGIARGTQRTQVRVKLGELMVS